MLNVMTTSKKPMTASQMGKIGGPLGGAARVPKGLARVSAEKKDEIIRASVLGKAVSAAAAVPPEPKGKWLALRNEVLRRVGSAAQRNAYQNGIDYFLAWLETNHLKLSAETIEQHREHLRQLGYAKPSVSMRMGGIRRLAEMPSVDALPRSHSARPPAPTGKHLKLRNRVLASITSGWSNRDAQISIDYFLSWLGGKEITGDSIVRHKQHLHEIGYSDGTINNRISSIRKLLAQ